MSTIADLVIKLRADTGDAETKVKSFSSKVGSGFRKALVPATAALTTFGIAAKVGFDELTDAQKVTAQTNAVLKSTGGVAGVTASHLDDLSNSMLKKTGVDDEAIRSGANVLLTFTNIRNEAGKGNDVFDQTTKTMLDMSTALGQDMKSSAIQLGKALNDPIRGVTALQRVGVSFTQQQRDQIKTLVQTGNTLGAQKLILGELNKEFGGSAEAAGKTFAGQMSRARESAKNFAAELVAGALPTLTRMAQGLTSVTGFLEQHQTALKIVVGAIVALSGVVLAVNVAMKLWTAATLVAKAATAAWTAAQWLLNAALSANPIGIVIIALVALGAALVVLWTKSETFRRIVTGTWNALRTTAGAVFGAIVRVVSGAWDAIRAATTAVTSFLKEHWRVAVVALAAILLGPLGALVALVATHWGQIKAATSAAWGAIRGAVAGAVDAIRSKVGAVFGALAGIVSGAVKAVQNGIGALVGAFSPILGVLHDIAGAAESAIGAIDRVVSAANKVGGVAGKVRGVLGHIPGFAGGVHNFGGGLALVGENGPELVNLPAGSDVYTNAESRGMLSSPSAIADGGDGDVVLVVDGEVLGRFARKYLTRKGERNAGIGFGG